MLERTLGGLLPQEYAFGSVVFFVNHILFFDFIGIFGLDAAVIWFLKFGGIRLPMGCGATDLVLAYLVLLMAGFYIAVHTSMCTQMNGKVLPEYLKMVAEGMEWRTIALRTNELAKKQGCVFHQIFYSGEQCFRYFDRSIVKEVDKNQFNIFIGDDEEACMDRELALNAVNTFKQDREFKQLRY